MSRAVYKYPLRLEDNFQIAMPFGAKIIHLAVQHDACVLWALVDPDAKIVPRSFRLIGTGQVVRDGELGEHVGSMLLADGAVVFHLFEANP